MVVLGESFEPSIANIPAENGEFGINYYQGSWNRAEMSHSPSNYKGKYVLLAAEITLQN